MKFLVTLDRDEDGWVVVECPALPGCVSQGRTVDEALQNVREAILASLETRRAEGFVLTVPLHDELGPGLLRALIRKAGLTVEEFSDLLC